MRPEWAGLIGAGLAMAVASPSPVLACGGAVVASGPVVRVLDGRTVQLAEGGLVRLAGIEVPALGPAATASREALALLVQGQNVTVRQWGGTGDRYGRLTGMVHTPASPDSLQQRLLAAGQAQIAARTGADACLALLRAAEHTARSGLIGLWSDPYYAVRQAAEPSRIVAEQGRFMLVEGRVLSVRASGGTVYINFGPSIGRDFAVTLSRRDLGRFSAAGIVPQALTGRRVRVRGVIEARGGPRIHAAVPEQIEIVETN